MQFISPEYSPVLTALSSLFFITEHSMSSLHLFFLAGGRKHIFDPRKGGGGGKNGIKEESDGQRLENHRAKGRTFFLYLSIAVLAS